MFITRLLTIGLLQPRWPWLGLAHLGCDRSGTIVALRRVKVCDCAHRTLVMKKGRNGLDTVSEMSDRIAPFEGFLFSLNFFSFNLGHEIRPLKLSGFKPFVYFLRQS